MRPAVRWVLALHTWFFQSPCPQLWGGDPEGEEPGAAGVGASCRLGHACHRVGKRWLWPHTCRHAHTGCPDGTSGCTVSHWLMLPSPCGALQSMPFPPPGRIPTSGMAKPALLPISVLTVTDCDFKVSFQCR